ncbi:MAG: acylphosphatase [Gammaproteobacteria bacterium]|jgi:acylphosphatase
MITIKGYVEGRVQGVGFRYFVKNNANQLNVAGYAKNLPDTRVEFVLQGEQAAITSLLQIINRGPSNSSVKSLESQLQDTDEHYRNFSIR